MIPTQSPTVLAAKKCVPCEGGVPGYSVAEAQAQVAALPLWRLTHLGTRIRRDWRLQNFRAVIKLLNTIGALAEREQHHPDMHLEGYCNAWIEIYTHAIGGLSENDFVLAAKIDTVSPPLAADFTHLPRKRACRQREISCWIAKAMLMGGL